MPEIERTAESALEGARIFFLDLGAGRILSARPDGSDLKVIVAGGQRHPDGLAADPKRGHLYWTNMGNLVANDGSIFRSSMAQKSRRWCRPGRATPIVTTKHVGA